MHAHIDDAPVTIKTSSFRSWKGLGRRLDPATDRRPQDRQSGSPVVGSGPAGMAAAQQLARARPQCRRCMKSRTVSAVCCAMASLISSSSRSSKRRMGQMKAEGVKFRTNTHVGRPHFPTQRLFDEFDAVVLTGGAEQPATCRSPDVNWRVSTSRWTSCAPTARWCRRCRGRARPDQRRRQGTWSSSAVVMGSDCIGTSNPSRCGLGDADRDPRQAAGYGRQGADLAGLAKQVAYLVLAGRGLRASLERGHQSSSVTATAICVRCIAPGPLGQG